MVKDLEKLLGLTSAALAVVLPVVAARNPEFPTSIGMAMAVPWGVAALAWFSSVNARNECRINTQINKTLQFRVHALEAENVRLDRQCDCQEDKTGGS